MKNILVTGVSKGLGFELTKSFLEEGNKVYGVSRSTNSHLDELKVKFPDTFLHLVYDLVNNTSVIELNKFIIQNKIIIHAFVNNAAVAYDDIITNAKYEKLEHMFRINVINPIMLTKIVIRNFLLYRQKGSIVHISSISSHTGYKGLSMYASTKGALESFSKNTAREWGLLGIRSNCVVPGFMNTEMSRNLSDKQREKIYSRTSLKKETEIMSVINTIKFLILEDSSSITGQNFFVDSGTI